jgi:mRNA interferase RelE/StbE
MEIAYKTSFSRDLKKCETALLPLVKDVIVNIENAQTLKNILNLKKLKGHTAAYRIKINGYRLCLFYENGIMTLVRFLPRKSVYRFFP